uniref:Uncharacterized protein n=1 Tax=Anguilla anguilla TaxID=7936 RepID=A0A0E9W0T4_ANGAN
MLTTKFFGVSWRY